MKHSIYKLMEYSEVSPGVQEIYDESKQMLGLPFVLNWIKCQGGDEELLTGNWSKLKHTLIMGKVPNILKQLIIYNVSTMKNCSYCSRAHEIFANLMGKNLSDDPDFMVTEHIDSEFLPLSYRMAIKVVTKAALNPSSITDSDMEDLSEAGYNDAEIKELMAQADLVNMLNTIADISGIKVDNELLEMAN